MNLNIFSNCMNLRIRTIILISLATVKITLAAEGVDHRQKVLQPPILLANDAIILVKKYLVNSEHVEINSYEFTDVSYRYYSDWAKDKEQFAGEWNIAFGLKEKPHPAVTTFSKNFK